jgi:hypothetical protein
MCSLNSNVLAGCPARLHQLPPPHFTFDRVLLKTPQTCERLRHPSVLPLASLRQHCHALNVVNDRHRQPPPWSKVDFVYSPSQTFWSQLLASENHLKPYYITSLELAFDYHMADAAQAQQAVFDLALGLRKLWPSRKFMWFENGVTLRRGVIWGPTFYFEQEGKPTCAKIYCRYPKLVRRGFDWSRPVARVEFTLNGWKNIKSKIGVEYLADLQGFNVTPFRDQYLRFELVNLEQLGRWLNGGSKNPAQTAESYLQQQVLADPQYAKHTYLTEQKWLSSSQVRGHLLKERKSEKQRKVGRPTLHEIKLRDLTDYRLNKMFDAV